MSEPPEWFTRVARHPAGEPSAVPSRGRAASAPAGHAQPAWAGQAPFLPGTEDATILIQRITDEAVPERDRWGGEPGGPAGVDGTAGPAAKDDPVAGMRTARTSGVVRAGALMAIATVVSRLSGLLAKIVLAAALGAAVVNNSYTLANTLPNIVFELLIGGVLTSVAIPLLTRAQRTDPDGGQEYTQRLMTLVIVGLVGATALAIAAAPLLTRLYLSDSSSRVDVALATDLARLLLPQILFYGIAAMFGAILNTQERFAANAWAPVVNNLVLIAVGVVLLSSDISGIGGPDGPAHGLSRTNTLVLGVGSTLGIVAQAVVMLPSLRRSGFRFRWRWGWDRRLGEAGGLVGWAIVYVLVSQVGVVLTTRIASGNAVSGGVTIFQTASLLFQMPYGILGVAVLTAIMPRMSRHAAAGQLDQVKQDMSLANRLSAVALLPVSAGLMVMGSAVAVLLFHHGRLDLDSALLIGITLGGLAVGLLPLAMTLVQMRVFYAMKDGRTPTLINAVMVAVRVPLLLVAASLSPELIIPGLAVATAASYLVGAVVGELWLRARFGPMGTRRTLTTVGKMLIASAGGGIASFVGTRALVGLRPNSIPDALAICLVAATIGVVTIALLAVLLRVEELAPVGDRVTRLLGRGAPRVAVDTASTPPAMAVSAGPGARPAVPAGPRPADPRTEVTRVTSETGGPTDGPASEETTRFTPVTEDHLPPEVPGASRSGTPVDPAGAGPHASASAPASDENTLDTRPDPRQAPVAPVAPLSPGATVGGRYRLVNLVTADGAGNRFWRARDTVLPRDMAVTLLAETGAASATVARTLRVGRLHHIGLPQTLDVGIHQGQSYVVGQWVDGATLTELLSTGPLEPDVATSITAKVSEAVAEAHRNGIALGAINPSLVRVNFDGQVRLSHVIAHGNATPDQDIRAVGALLYLMLTGTWPLSADPGRAAGVAAGGGPGTPDGAEKTVVLDSGADGHGLPSAPTRRGRELPAAQVRPGIPEALSALADRALHPDDPEGIHAVGAIASLLRQPENSPTVSAQVPSEPVESLRPAERRLIRERRVKLSIAAVMLLAFAALIVIVVASLAKQALAGVQDPTATDAGRSIAAGATGSSGTATGSTPGATSATGNPAGSTRVTTTGKATASTRPSGTRSSASGSATRSTATPPPATPDKITAATVYDPAGDGNKDNIGQAERAFDGDPTSAWQTFVYKQQFPTLKPGVGLTLQLQRATVPVSATVSSDTPGTKVEFRTATGPDVPLAATKLVGTALITGAGPVTATLAGAPKSQYLIVFVTQLGSTGQGFQSGLNEISLNGS